MSLSDQNPGGCYLGFNAVIDRDSAARLINVCGDARAEGFKEIHIAISSPGGSLPDAFYAYNMLQALPANLVIYNAGSVQSAANILFQGGERRYATPGSSFFFHLAAFDCAPGQRLAEPFTKRRLRTIQLDDRRTAEMLAERTGQTAKCVREWHLRELTMDPSEAVLNGVAHGVRPFKVPPDAFFKQIVSQS